MENFFRLSEDVADALTKGRPVVALESTVISHGLPYPDNLETALKLESAVREEGAVPATILVWGGEVVVGASQTELEIFAQTENILKLSSKDLAFALLAKQAGSTTVAATMFCAHKVGISFFATGGIGGVHRGAADSWDVSADLHQFTHTPVAVVCSGAKSILDLPKTLEYLETLSVPVVGLGSKEFPAFYSRGSGLFLDQWVEDEKAMADLVRTQWQLAPDRGVIIANPIPEHEEIPAQNLTSFIDQALSKARAQGVTGKAVTPHLLSQIKELTQGASLEANKALLENNACIAARIAKCY